MYHIQNVHKILLLLFRISMEKIKKDHLFIIHILAAIIAVIVINDCDAQGKYVLFGKTLLAFNYICKMSPFQKNIYIRGNLLFKIVNLLRKLICF